jgi:hypothetical protein
MLIAGDADVARLEHVVEFVKLMGGGVPGDLMGLPKARLAVLPGTTHVTIVERWDWIVQMALEFFEAGIKAK